MGVLQHHDAITGTSKQAVINDYVKQLHSGIVEAEKPLGEIIRNLNKGLNITLDLASCLLSNVSVCTTLKGDAFVVVVYNSLSWSVTHYVRLPIEYTSVTVTGPDGIEACDIVPTVSTFDWVQSPFNKENTNDVLFVAKKVPAMGYKIYYVASCSRCKGNCKPAGRKRGPLDYGNNKASFTVDGYKSNLVKVTLNGVTLNITQNFFYYISKHSGPYVFQPWNDTIHEIGYSIDETRNISGNIIEEHHQRWVSKHSIYITQCMRVYKDENYIEFDWLVGNISIWQSHGIEVVSKFMVTEDFDNNNVFYTDSNGREMMRRVLHQRPDYRYDSGREPVSSNYYPVSSKIVIRDLKRNIEVAVLTDRSQGGTSLKNGEIELMVHRRMLYDDYKGVGEGLNEMEFGLPLFVRGTHYLVVGPVVPPAKSLYSTAAKERKLAQEKLSEPWIGIATTNLKYEAIAKIMKRPFSPVQGTEIPRGVNIMTFEPWARGSYLLRLEHFLEKDEDRNLSRPKQINLKKIFKNFTITDLEETTLGGNQLMSDFNKKAKYKWETTGTPMNVCTLEADQSKFVISLSPMQIRTFIVHISFGITMKPMLGLLLTLFVIKCVI